LFEFLNSSKEFGSLRFLKYIKWKINNKLDIWTKWIFTDYKHWKELTTDLLVDTWILQYQ
jgi:hypothetical protein